MARCMSARHLAKAVRFGGEVAPRQRRVGFCPGVGSPVEISQGSEGQCPPVGTPGEVLLAEGQVAPIALPAHQRERDVGEPGTGQRRGDLDVGVWAHRQAAEELEDQPVVVDKRGVGLFGGQGPRPLCRLEPAAGRPQQRQSHFGVDRGVVVDAIPDVADEGVFVALQVLGDLADGPFGDNDLVIGPLCLDDRPKQPPRRAPELGQAA